MFMILSISTLIRISILSSISLFPSYPHSSYPGLRTASKPGRTRPGPGRTRPGPDPPETAGRGALVWVRLGEPYNLDTEIAWVSGGAGYKLDTEIASPALTGAGEWAGEGVCGNRRAVRGAWLAVASDCYHHHYTIIIIVIVMLIMIIIGSEQARAVWHARPAVVSGGASDGAVCVGWSVIGLVH